MRNAFSAHQSRSKCEPTLPVPHTRSNTRMTASLLTRRTSGRSAYTVLCRMITVGAISPLASLICCRKGSRCAAANCKAIFSTLDVNRVRVRSNNSKDEQVQPEWIVACEISNPPSSSSSSDHSSSDTPPISLHRCGPKFGPIVRTQ